MDRPLPMLGGAPCLETGCSACCHGTEMLLTEADMRRLDARNGDDDYRREEDGYVLLRTRDGPEGPCVFLAEDGRCTVHDDRPEGCRLYPAIWDVDAGEAILDSGHCPHTDRFSLPRAIADAVRRLASRLEQERDRRLAKP